MNLSTDFLNFYDRFSFFLKPFYSCLALAASGLLLFFIFFTPSAFAQKKSEAPMPSSILPEKFTARIGGFLGPTFGVEWKDNALVYHALDRTKQPNESTQKITPTEKQWEEFWKKIDQVHLFDWSSDYENWQVADGTQWIVEIEYGGKKIATKGSNSFPRDGAVKKPSKDPEPTKVFREFLKAVEDLLGGKTFG